MQITKLQLPRLQVLYAQLARHEIGVGTDRLSRLRWATERLNKPVASFSALTADDAGFLIDQLQQTLGVKMPAKKRPARDQARRAGLDGRADGQEFADAPQMVTPEDIALIQRLLGALGWSDEGFTRFLNSAKSPFARRADKQIRTVADANKVWWALKPIAKRKGVWRGKP
jgi:hypothetical protein